MFDYINAFSQAIKIQNAGEIASLLTKDKIRKSFRPHPSTYGLPSKIEKVNIYIFFFIFK